VQTLKILRETDLKPYIIFVSPPNMEKLRQLQMALGKLRPTVRTVVCCVVYILNRIVYELEKEEEEEEEEIFFSSSY
jgi:hypothetical protein